MADSDVSKYKPPVHTDPATGRELEVWEQSLRDYLDLKPPQQAEFWRRVHRSCVAEAVKRGDLKRELALEDYTETELDVANTHNDKLRERKPEPEREAI